jgi:hydrogenase/urease accessory protein HupE
VKARGLAWLLAALAAMLVASPALAHELRPAYLELKEASPGRFDVLFKRPMIGELVLPLTPVFPPEWREVGARKVEDTPTGQVERWSMETGGAASTSGVLVLDGLSCAATDAIVRVERLDGPAQSAVLRPDAPSLRLDEAVSSTAGYVRLGVEHILYGLDHLLFVLALLLLTRGAWRIVKTITAFTIAHSITLAAAGLGFVRVPVPPVEATIALSIVFVAAEVLRAQRGETGTAERSPWIVAFAFGLLHGFGFAGTLGKLGLPAGEIPWALLTFNVGVELGQLAVVFVYLAFVRSLGTLTIAWPKWARPLPAYAVGSVAAAFFVQRVAAIVEGG